MRFACKNVSLKKILECSFNFNKTEYKIFKVIIRKEEPVSVKSLSEDIGLTESSVQKGLKTLLNKRIIKRKQVNKEKGGFYYLYYLKDKKAFKNRLIKKIDNWSSNIKKEMHQL